MLRYTHTYTHISVVYISQAVANTLCAYVVNFTTKKWIKSWKVNHHLLLKTEKKKNPPKTCTQERKGHSFFISLSCLHEPPAPVCRTADKSASCHLYPRLQNHRHTCQCKLVSRYRESISQAWCEASSTKLLTTRLILGLVGRHQACQWALVILQSSREAFVLAVLLTR